MGFLFENKNDEFAANAVDDSVRHHAVARLKKECFWSRAAALAFVAIFMLQVVLLLDAKKSAPMSVSNTAFAMFWALMAAVSAARYVKSQSDLRLLLVVEKLKSSS